MRFTPYIYVLVIRFKAKGVKGREGKSHGIEST